MVVTMLHMSPIFKFFKFSRASWFRTQREAVAAIISPLIVESLYFQFLGRTQQLSFSAVQHIFPKVTVHPVNFSPPFSVHRRVNPLEEAYTFFIVVLYDTNPPPPHNAIATKRSIT
jgi:hypothetical protein